MKSMERIADTLARRIGVLQDEIVTANCHIDELKAENQVLKDKLKALKLLAEGKLDNA